MEEETRMDWLEGQAMSIPVEEFIKLRIELASLKARCSELCSNKWDLQREIEALKEENVLLRKNLDDAKSQIKKLLGVDEEKTDADDGR